MIKLAQDSQARTEKLFTQLKAQGVTLLPAAQKHYDKGDSGAEQRHHAPQPEPPLGGFGGGAHLDDPLQGRYMGRVGSAKVDKVETQTVDSVNATIQRGQNVVQKLNVTIVKLAADGKDVTSARRTSRTRRRS